MFQRSTILASLWIFENITLINRNSLNGPCHLLGLQDNIGQMDFALQLTYALDAWWTTLQRKSKLGLCIRLPPSYASDYRGYENSADSSNVGFTQYKYPSLYAESRAMKAAIRLKFAGSCREVTFGHAAILSGRDLDEILTLRGDRYLDDDSPSFLNPNGLVWYTDGSKTSNGKGRHFGVLDIKRK